MYIVLAKCLDNILQEMKDSFLLGAEEAVSWAHWEDPHVPSFANRASVSL